MSSSNFQTQLFDWINESLAETISDSVIAFCFNLMEPYTVNLIGSAEFDLKNEDWACTESFVPTKQGIRIPESVCSGDWEECLSTMSTLIGEYLSSDRPEAKVLTSNTGVPVGFVDGDLTLSVIPLVLLLLTSFILPS